MANPAEHTYLIQKGKTKPLANPTSGETFGIPVRFFLTCLVGACNKPDSRW